MLVSHCLACFVQTLTTWSLHHIINTSNLKLSHLKSIPSCNNILNWIVLSLLWHCAFTQIAYQCPYSLEYILILVITITFWLVRTIMKWQKYSIWMISLSMAAMNMVSFDKKMALISPKRFNHIYYVNKMG